MTWTHTELHKCMQGASMLLPTGALRALGSGPLLSHRGDRVPLGVRWADIVTHNTWGITCNLTSPGRQWKWQKCHLIFCSHPREPHERADRDLGLHVFVWGSTSSRVQGSSLCSTGDQECTQLRFCEWYLSIWTRFKHKRDSVFSCAPISSYLCPWQGLPR